MRKHALSMTIIASIVGVLANVPTTAQTLNVDPGRDRALHTHIRVFLADPSNDKLVEAHLRDYLDAFNARPYLVSRLNINWQEVSEQRLQAFLLLIYRLVGAPVEAYFKGELSPTQAAAKVAPLFLILPGIGLGTERPGDQAELQQTATDLLDAIHAYAAPSAVFATVGEGYTSTDARRGANLAFRMFSTPDVAAICAAAPTPASLDAGGLKLSVGEPFPLTRIAIVARDADGALLGAVPVRVELEETEPRLFNTRSDALAESALDPTSPGTFRLRARTICPGVDVQTIIDGTIR